MKMPFRHSFALAATALYCAGASAQTSSGSPPPTPPAAPADQQPQKLDSVQVTGKRLDDARNGLSPDTGSSIYRLEKSDIKAMPLGESTPLNQVLLQAPGVVQDSYGQLHVRGDHANLQYRINGVVIPEAISGFGQALDTHFAQSINVLTGALPAQYGYRTAGIVDIRTNGTGFENEASVSLLGGSRGDAEGSVELAGHSGAWSAFVTSSFLRNNEGIENPTSSRSPLHDTTKQQKNFAYLSNVLSENTRVSLLVGSANSKFEIPNVPGQTPPFSLAGAPVVDSSTLDARQNEKNIFQIVTLQSSPTDLLDFQLSAFHRYTDVAYQPDPIGDLVFGGIGAQVVRKNEASGLQGDLAYHLGEHHTVRGGFFAQRERFGVDNTSTVFAADDDGNQTSDVPFRIIDNSHLTGVTYGVYLQDEWQPIKALTVNYGVRFDHVATVVNEKQWSPRLGLVYDLGPNTRIHAGYSRYFTPPPTETIDTTTVQAFQGTTNALPSDANTSVSSERSNYFDVGISQQVTPALTVGVDAFYRRVRNLQDEGQFGNALIFSAFNFAQGRIGGVEFSTAYRQDHVSAYANVSVSRAQGRNIVSGQFNFDPDELAFIQNHWVHLDHDQTVTASGGVSYQFGTSRVGADLLFGSGLRDGFANSEHLPSYLQVNLSASHTFDAPVVGKAEVRLAVINVFDRTYEIRDGTGIGVGAPQFGPRRGFFGGVTKTF